MMLTHSKITLSAEQCRRARELLGWHQQRLALMTNSCIATIIGFESGEKQTRELTIKAIRATLEAAGVIFVEETGEGPGVRLRKPPP